MDLNVLLTIHSLNFHLMYFYTNANFYAWIFDILDLNILLYIGFPVDHNLKSPNFKPKITTFSATTKGLRIATFRHYFKQNRHFFAISLASFS